MGSDNLPNKNDNPHHYYTDRPHTTCSTHTCLYRDRCTVKGIHMQCHPSRHPQALQYNHLVEYRDTYRHPGSFQEGMYILHLTIHHSYMNNPVDLPHSFHTHPCYSLRDREDDHMLNHNPDYRTHMFPHYYRCHPHSIPLECKSHNRRGNLHTTLQTPYCKLRHHMQAGVDHKGLGSPLYRNCSLPRCYTDRPHTTDNIRIFHYRDQCTATHIRRRCRPSKHHQVLQYSRGAQQGDTSTHP